MKKGTLKESKVPHKYIMWKLNSENHQDDICDVIFKFFEQAILHILPQNY